MKKVVVLFFCLILAISSYAQESVNLSFNLIEQYTMLIGSKTDYMNPDNRCDMNLTFDGNFLRVDHSNGKNYLHKKVEGWTIEYKYDKYSNNKIAKVYILDVLEKGQHLYYLIEYSQLTSSVQKSLYIPYVSNGMIYGYFLFQSKFYTGEKI